MNKDLREDMERIADLIDEVQRKHDGIYVCGCHCKDSDISAHVTVCVDGEYINYTKYEQDDDNGSI